MSLNSYRPSGSIYGFRGEPFDLWGGVGDTKKKNILQEHLYQKIFKLKDAFSRLYCFCSKHFNMSRWKDILISDVFVT